MDQSPLKAEEEGPGSPLLSGREKQGSQAPPQRQCTRRELADWISGRDGEGEAGSDLQAGPQEDIYSEGPLVSTTNHVPNQNHVWED